MPPAAPVPPAPWLMFLIMFALISLAVGIIVLLGGMSRALRGESFWPHDHTMRPAAGKVRSARMTGQFRRANGVQQRSPRPNAEKATVQTVQPFQGRSIVQPVTNDLPANIDELQRLAHTIALYAKRPNKELAILEAWGATKGEGDAYQRASRLFDAAMSDAAKQAAKAKPQQQIAETA